MVEIDLTGKTYLVTGGSQGLGAATVRRLHAAGGSVFINYFPDESQANRQRAEELAGELGSRAVPVPADVTDREQVDAMFAAIRQHGYGLHGLVNNAAVIRDRTLRKMTDDEWEAVISTNLTGVFRVCRAAADVLADGGRIVSLASISGVVGFFGQANYASAKAGVIALTKVLSKELASRRITVNAVAPGVVLTDMGASIPEAVRSEMLKNIPLGCFGEPDDIANAILFLCSDLAKYVSGQTLHVNGGWWG